MQNAGSHKRQGINIDFDLKMQWTFQANKIMNILDAEGDWLNSTAQLSNQVHILLQTNPIECPIFDGTATITAEMRIAPLCWMYVKTINTKMKNVYEMRIQTCFCLVALLFAATISSCKKKDQNEDSNTQQNGSTSGSSGDTLSSNSTLMHFSALIGQTSFEADTSEITYSFDSASNLHVFTFPDNTNKAVIIMLASLEPGTYAVDFDHAMVSYQAGSALYNGGFNPQGSLTISTNSNNRISGVFNANLFDFSSATDINLTQGVFENIPYTN